MTVNLSMALVLAVLYSAGFYLLMQRSLMRILIGIVIVGHGANLLLQLAGGPPARPPMLDGEVPGEMADPLPQAMALTAVVITFALTAFLLALAYRAWSLLGDDEVRDDLEDRRIRRLERRLAEAEDDSDDGPDDAATELKKEATQ